MYEEIILCFRNHQKKICLIFFGNGKINWINLNKSKRYVETNYFSCIWKFVEICYRWLWILKKKIYMTAYYIFAKFLKNLRIVFSCFIDFREDFKNTKIYKKKLFFSSANKKMKVSWCSLKITFKGETWCMINLF